MASSCCLFVCLSPCRSLCSPTPSLSLCSSCPAALFVCCYFSASFASNFSATSCLAIILPSAGVDVDVGRAAIAAAACGWQRCQVLHPFPVDSQWRVNRICFNLNLFAAHQSQQLPYSILSLSPTPLWPPLLPPYRWLFNKVKQFHAIKTVFH